MSEQEKVHQLKEKKNITFLFLLHEIIVFSFLSFLIYLVRGENHQILTILISATFGYLLAVVGKRNHKNLTK